METYREEHIIYLWESFLTGDDKSFSTIYELYINQLISYGYKLCTDREIVHDSLQEIFIDLFLKRNKLNVDIRNLKAYLFISLRNSLVKKIKNKKRFELLDLKDNNFEFDFDVEYSHQDRLIEDEISRELKKVLQAATKKLPAKQKEIIYLKFEEEMSYPEIAKIMNISIESARKLLYRALLSLRSKVHSDSFTPSFFILFSKISLK
ncbi:MAG: RNA polymerase sigma factor [Draconibacterium sp.]